MFYTLLTDFIYEVTMNVAENWNGCKKCIITVHLTHRHTFAQEKAQIFSLIGKWYMTACNMYEHDSTSEREMQC